MQQNIKTKLICVENYTTQNSHTNVAIQFNPLMYKQEIGGFCSLHIDYKITANIKATTGKNLDIYTVLLSTSHSNLYNSNTNLHFLCNACMHVCAYKEYIRWCIIVLNVIQTERTLMHFFTLNHHLPSTVFQILNMTYY